MINGISTIKRFLYLNIYAFLLLFVGGGLLITPSWRVHLILYIFQVIGGCCCLKGAFSILSTWDDKKRKYAILMQRNAKAFRKDTFKEFMQAPCGRLLVKIVLQDMNMPEQYNNLLLEYKPNIKQLKTCREDVPSNIYINPKYSQKK